MKCFFPRRIIIGIPRTGFSRSLDMFRILSFIFLSHIRGSEFMCVKNSGIFYMRK